MVKRVLDFKTLPDFRLWLKFSDGREGAVDLSDLAGHGVFAAWNRPGVFAAAKLSEFGAVEWQGGIDLCPDALYLRMTGEKPEDLFPSLRHPTAHA